MENNSTSSVIDDDTTSTAPVNIIKNNKRKLNSFLECSSSSTEWLLDDNKTTIGIIEDVLHEFNVYDRNISILIPGTYYYRLHVIYVLPLRIYYIDLYGI